MKPQLMAQPLSVVLDTHVLLWALFDRSQLSRTAAASFAAAEAAGAPIYIPTVSFVEIRYLVEKGKFTERAYQECLNQVNDLTTARCPALLDLGIADALAQIPRITVPDMPDRIIAATALALGLPLLSADTEIRRLSNVSVIW